MDIDWGNIGPTDDMRDAVERCMEPHADIAGERLSFRRCDGGYEARILARLPDRPATLRLDGDDLLELAARAANLARELRRGSS